MYFAAIYIFSDTKNPNADFPTRVRVTHFTHTQTRAVLLKTEKDFCHRKELLGTEKDLDMACLTIKKNLCSRTSDITMILISTYIMLFEL